MNHVMILKKYDRGIICVDKGNTFKEIKTCIKFGSSGGNEIWKDSDECMPKNVWNLI